MRWILVGGEDGEVDSFIGGEASGLEIWTKSARVSIRLIKVLVSQSQICRVQLHRLCIASIHFQYVSHT